MKIKQKILIIALTLTAVWCGLPVSSSAQQIDYTKEARLRMAKNDFDGAIQFFTKCIEADAEKFHCYGERGVAYEKKYKHDLALADYQKAVALAPDITSPRLKPYAPKPKYLTKIGEIYNFKADYDKAAAAFERALAIDAEYYDAIVGLGIAAFPKDRQRAADYFLRAMNLKPNQPQAYYEVAKIFELIGDEPSFRQAYQYYSKAIAADPAYAPAYYGRFQVQRYGNPDKAKYEAESFADLSKYIELKPDSADGYYMRGLVYSLEMNKYPEAVRDFTRAIELRPDAEYYHARAEAHIAARSPQNAIDDLTKYIEMSKNAGPDKFEEALMRRAEAYIYFSQHEKAVGDISKYLELQKDPQSVKVQAALTRRAPAYIALGKKDLAIADWRALLKIDPNDEMAKRALQRLGAQP